jgi:hypothetical protein
VPGEGGFGQGAPRCPVPLLAEFVDRHFVVGAAAACFAAGGADGVAGAVGEPEVFVAVDVADAAPFGGEVGAGEDGVLGEVPLLAGEFDLLGGAEDAGAGLHEHAPGADGAFQMALALLAGHDDQDDAEPERPVGHQFQGVDGGPPLPGKQWFTAELREVGYLIAKGCAPVERPERRRPEPRFGFAEEWFRHAANPCWS